MLEQTGRARRRCLGLSGVCAAVEQPLHEVAANKPALERRKGLLRDAPVLCTERCIVAILAPHVCWNLCRCQGKQLVAD